MSNIIYLISEKNSDYKGIDKYTNPSLDNLFYRVNSAWAER